eukprot:349741-Chlamydomonas_euryale.AAC.5
MWLESIAVKCSRSWIISTLVSPPPPPACPPPPPVASRPPPCCPPPPPDVSRSTTPVAAPPRLASSPHTAQVPSLPSSPPPPRSSLPLLSAIGRCGPSSAVDGLASAACGSAATSAGPCAEASRKLRGRLPAGPAAAPKCGAPMGLAAATLHAAEPSSPAAPTGVCVETPASVPAVCRGVLAMAVALALGLCGVAEVPAAAVALSVPDFAHCILEEERVEVQ